MSLKTIKYTVRVNQVHGPKSDILSVDNDVAMWSQCRAPTFEEYSCKSLKVSIFKKSETVCLLRALATKNVKNIK